MISPSFNLFIHPQIQPVSSVGPRGASRQREGERRCAQIKNRRPTQIAGQRDTRLIAANAG